METVNFLLDRPLALLVVLLIGALIGIGFERAFAKADAARRKAYWRGRNAAKFGKKGPSLAAIEAAERRQKAASSSAALGLHDAADFAADQLKLVSGAQFSSRSLLPPSEHLDRRARRGEEGSAAQGGDRVSRGDRGAYDAE